MSTQTEPKLVTQIDFARAGQITPQMKEVAEREHRDPEYIRSPFRAIIGTRAMSLCSCS